MNEENTQKLYQDFPRLYRNAHADVKSTGMCWGFECGDGWFRLIHDLSAAIEAEAIKVGLDPESEEWPMAAQVKEKFGTLRLYLRGYSDPIHELINHAEEKSEHICEECGLAGTLRTEGWWHVSCEPCEQKRRERSLSAH